MLKWIEELWYRKDKMHRTRLPQEKDTAAEILFSVGDRVRIKSHIDGRWNTSGTVVEARPSGTTSQPASFLIKTTAGAELLRHKSYLKHDVRRQQDIDLDDGSVSASGEPVGVTTALMDPVLPTDTAAPSDPAARPWKDRLRVRKPRE